MTTVKLNSYVKITGFSPGHGLYLAEGTVEGTLPADAEHGELVQVSLERPHQLRGKLVHVAPERVERRRRR